MINSPLDRKIAGATRTLALLEAEASRLRGELIVLRRALLNDTKAVRSGQAAHLLEANEQLVLAALHSNRIAETAVSELLGITSSNQRDALTNTPNRALMLDRIEQSIYMSERTGTRFAVLSIDLNNFKAINDLYGHAAGDEALCFVARQLEATARGTDSVSRFGGDEFLVLLKQIGPTFRAAPVAAKMLAAIHEPKQIRGGTLQLSASIGVAIYPSDGKDAPSLIAHVDEAMYRDKREKRGGVERTDALPPA